MTTKTKAKNPRRRRKRRRNPWTPLEFGMVGVAIAVVGVGVHYAMWRSRNKIAARITGKDVYYYWANTVPGGQTGIGFGNKYAPYIQNAKTGEIFSLPDQITEQGALWAAKSEIENRGGIPQQGQPI